MRLLWRGVGIAVLVAGIAILVVAIKNRWGLAAVSIPVIGLLLMLFAGKMPRRTPKGTAMYSRIEGFKQIFDMGQGVREQFAERQNIFSEYLPFAIVYGSTKKWAKAFEGLDAQVTQSTQLVVHVRAPVHCARVRRHDGGLLDDRDRHALCQHALVVGRQRVQRRLLWWRWRWRWRRQLVIADRA